MDGTAFLSTQKACLFPFPSQLASYTYKAAQPVLAQLLAMVVKRKGFQLLRSHDDATCLLF